MRATKKRFEKHVNLHSEKVTFKGVRQTMRLCTKCLRRVREEMKKLVEKKELAKKTSEASSAQVATAA